jgi:hypothetical protein
LGSRPRRSRSVTLRLVVNSVATVAGFSGLMFLLYARSVHDQAGTSDKATVILEGQAMASGHLLLQGWNLTFASYWTSDAPLYALAVRLDGLRPALLYLGPAVMAALVVIAGVFIAREGCRGVPALAGGVAVVALLAFCTPAMALFFVGRGFHVSTVLYALLAFAALRRGRFGPGWVLAVVLLVAGMLGDLLLVAYGAIPLLLAGLLAGLRQRRWQSAASNVTASLASVGIAALARRLADARGAFRSQPALSVVNLHQIFANLGHAPGYFSDLLGLTNGLRHNGGVPFGLRAVHVVGALCVLACLVVALRSLVTGFRRPRTAPSPAGVSETWRLDDVLIITVLCSIVPFVAFARADQNGVRYLAVSVMFTTIVAGRQVARAWPKVPVGRPARAIAAVAVAMCLCFVAGVGYSLSSPEPQYEVPSLVAWLSAHDLRWGVGDYWAASITTVQSGGTVVVRPVEAAAGGALQKMTTLSTSSWYRGQEWQFLVYGKPIIDNVDFDAALRTWGPPAETHVIGPYHILVWSHPVVLPNPA